MSHALYRRYRPQRWSEVIAQDHVLQTLRHALRADRVGHAYLFAGARGTGKTTVARLLAKAVNCLGAERDDRPDNQCEHCKAVNEGRFLDVIEIDAASNTGVDDVRELRDKINFAPSQGKYKVYIIDEVHMLSTAAFNALLKTLEEPPPHVIFILATTELHKIPATVLSRCQQHEFRRVPVDAIQENLRLVAKADGIEADDDALRLIARQATGSIRDAQSLLDQLSSAGDRITVRSVETVLGTAGSDVVVDLVTHIAAQDAGGAMRRLHVALDGGADVRTLARQLVDYLRGVLLTQMDNAAAVEASEGTKDQMRSHAGAFSRPTLAVLIRLFRDAAAEHRGDQLALGLELAVAEAIFPARSTREDPAPGTPSPSGRSTATGPRAQANSTSTAEIVPAADAATLPGRAEIQAAAGAIGSAEIRTAWKDIAHALAKSNPKLAALMNSARSLEVHGTRLMVGFSGEILARQLEKTEYVTMLSQALEESTGARLEIRSVLTNSRGGSPPNVVENGMVAAALDSGGEIVDVQD